MGVLGITKEDLELLRDRERLAKMGDGINREPDYFEQHFARLAAHSEEEDQYFERHFERLGNLHREPEYHRSFLRGAMEAVPSAIADAISVGQGFDQWVGSLPEDTRVNVEKLKRSGLSKKDIIGLVKSGKDAQEASMWNSPLHPEIQKENLKKTAPLAPVHDAIAEEIRKGAETVAEYGGRKFAQRSATREEDGWVKAVAHGALESGPFGMAFRAVPMAATLMGGAAAGYIAGMPLSLAEARMEAGETYRTLIKEGRSIEDALRAAYGVRDDNIKLLSATNASQRFLEDQAFRGGVLKNLSKLPGIGPSLAKSLPKALGGKIHPLLAVALDMFIEGFVEEGGQYTSSTLRSDKEWKGDDYLFSSAVGTLGAGMQNTMGIGISKGVQQYHKHQEAKYNKELREKELASVREWRDQQVEEYRKKKGREHYREEYKTLRETMAPAEARHQAVLNTREWLDLDDTKRQLREEAEKKVGYTEDLLTGEDAKRHLYNFRLARLEEKAKVDVLDYWNKKADKEAEAEFSKEEEEFKKRPVLDSLGFQKVPAVSEEFLTHKPLPYYRVDETGIHSIQEVSDGTESQSVKKYPGATHKNVDGYLIPLNELNKLTVEERDDKGNVKRYPYRLSSEMFHHEKGVDRRKAHLEALKRKYRHQYGLDDYDANFKKLQTTMYAEMAKDHLEGIASASSLIDPHLAAQAIQFAELINAVREKHGVRSEPPSPAFDSRGDMGKEQFMGLAQHLALKGLITTAEQQETAGKMLADYVAANESGGKFAVHQNMAQVLGDIYDAITGIKGESAQRDAFINRNARKGRFEKILADMKHAANKMVPENTTVEDITPEDEKSWEENKQDRNVSTTRADDERYVAEERERRKASGLEEDESTLDEKLLQEGYDIVGLDTASTRWFEIYRGFDDGAALNYFLRALSDYSELMVSVPKGETLDAGRIKKAMLKLGMHAANSKGRVREFSGQDEASSDIRKIVAHETGISERGVYLIARRMDTLRKMKQVVEAEGFIGRRAKDLFIQHSGKWENPRSEFGKLVATKRRLESRIVEAENQKEGYEHALRQSGLTTEDLSQIAGMVRLLEGQLSDMQRSLDGVNNRLNDEKSGGSIVEFFAHEARISQELFREIGEVGRVRVNEIIEAMKKAPLRGEEKGGRARKRLHERADNLREEYEKYLAAKKMDRGAIKKSGEKIVDDFIGLTVNIDNLSEDVAAKVRRAVEVAIRESLGTESDRNSFKRTMETELDIQRSDLKASLYDGKERMDSDIESLEMLIEMYASGVDPVDGRRYVSKDGKPSGGFYRARDLAEKWGVKYDRKKVETILQGTFQPEGRHIPDLIRKSMAAVVIRDAIRNEFRTRIRATNILSKMYDNIKVRQGDDLEYTVRVPLLKQGFTANEARKTAYSGVNQDLITGARTATIVDLRRAMQDGTVFIIDTETLGLSHDKDIHQIAVIKVVNGREVERKEWDLRSNQELTEFAKEHGKTKEDLLKGIPRQKAFNELRSFMGNGGVVVAHNIGFDWENIVLQSRSENVHLDSGNYKGIDTCQLARLMLEGSEAQKTAIEGGSDTRDATMGYTLDDLARLFGKKPEDAHTAMADADTTFFLVNQLMDIGGGRKAVEGRRKVLSAEQTWEQSDEAIPFPEVEESKTDEIIKDNTFYSTVIPEMERRRKKAEEAAGVREEAEKVRREKEAMEAESPVAPDPIDGESATLGVVADPSSFGTKSLNEASKSKGWIGKIAGWLLDDKARLPDAFNAIWQPVRRFIEGKEFAIEKAFDALHSEFKAGKITEEQFYHWFTYRSDIDLNEIPAHLQEHVRSIKKAVEETILLRGKEGLDGGPKSFLEMLMRVKRDRRVDPRGEFDPAATPSVEQLGQFIVDAMAEQGVSPEAAVELAQKLMAREIHGDKKLEQLPEYMQRFLGYAPDASTRLYLAARTLVRDTGRRITEQYLLKTDMVHDVLPTDEYGKPIKGYVRLQSDGKTKYGELEGKFVQKEVAAELHRDEQARSEIVQAYLMLHSMFKQNKIIYSTTSYVNNFFGNFFLMQMSGIPLYYSTSHYLECAKDVFRYLKTGKASPRLEKAIAHGLFSGTMMRAELALSAGDYAAIEAQKDMSGMLKTLAKALHTLENNSVGRSGRALYEGIEQIHRYIAYTYFTEVGANASTQEYGGDPLTRALKPLATLVNRRQVKLDAAGAVREVNKVLFDYRDLPKGVRLLRDTGIPFISFPFLAGKAVIRNLYHNPRGVAAMIVTGMILRAMVRGMFDKELELEGWIPYWELLDPQQRAATRFNLTEWDKTMGNFTPGGPLVSLVEAAKGETYFGEYPVWGERDSDSEKAASGLMHIVATSAPALVVNWWRNYGRYADGKLSGSNFLLRGFGLRVRDTDPARLRKDAYAITMRMQREIKEFRRHDTVGKNPAAIEKRAMALNRRLMRMREDIVQLYRDYEMPINRLYDWHADNEE